METGLNLPAIDWDRPWFAPWAPAGRPVAEAWAAGASVAAALEGATAPGAEPAPRFVPAAGQPAGVPYEAHILASGTVPTRDNLHDLFNGLVWRRFPRSKRQLNRLQAAEIARDGIGGTRGPVRDAITVFDENGALLLAPDTLWQALAARDWQGLFVTRRALWAEARCVLFGHALLEKLVAPRKDITAHVLRAPQGLEGDAALDGWLATALTPTLLEAKPFAPLPVLGVPGWWPANGEAGFYDDARVFRSRRVPGM